MRRVHGFTLVELLIALVIFGIVIAQAFAMFGVQHVTQTKTGRSLEIQQDVRLVSDAILFDVRQAGFLVPRVAGVSSRDGGNAAADALCISDGSVFAESEIDGALDHFDRAHIGGLGVGGNDNDVVVAAGHLDIDGDGNDDFAVDAGIIIADGDESHCATITNITGNTITFAPNTPGGFVATSVLGGSGRVVPATIWQLSGTDLERNGLRLSTQIEDLQVEFGIDRDGDGQLVGATEVDVDVLTATEPAEIRQVTISVVARTDAEDEEVTSSGRPAVANRAAGTADGFRRRRITSSVLPRNML